MHRISASIFCARYRASGGLDHLCPATNVSCVQSRSNEEYEGLVTGKVVKTRVDRRRTREPVGGRVSELRDIAISSIDIPKRPARRFLGDIAALADSMQTYGLQQPISVRAQGDRFALTSGLRRFSAASLLGWNSIP